MKKELQRLSAFFTYGQALRHKAARGGAWVGSAVMVDRLLRLVRNIILARLLFPEAFGVMAIVLAIYQAFESFTDLGINKVIVQNPKGDTRDYLNSAFWLSLARTSLLYAIVFVSAPFISRFYQMPELTDLIRVVFAGAVCKGAWSPAAFAATKNLRFGRWVLVAQGSGVIGIVVSITLAFYLKNVWALAFGIIIENLFGMLLSFLAFPFKPSIRFNREVLKEFSAFSRGFAGLPILTFIFMKADVFFLGRMSSPMELGIYTMAVSLAVVPFESLSSILNQIGFSAFSKRQNDNEWTNRSIIFLTSVIASLGFPLLALAACCGGEILGLIYGRQYSACAVAFALLFAANLMKTTGLPIVQVYLSRGMPKIHRTFSGLRAALILLFLFPAIHWLGLTGAALAGLCAMTLPYIVQIKGIRRITGLDYRSYLMVYLRTFLLMAPPLGLWALTLAAGNVPAWLSLSAAGAGVILSWAVGGRWLYLKYREYTSKMPIPATDPPSVSVVS